MSIFNFTHVVHPPSIPWLILSILLCNYHAKGFPVGSVVSGSNSIANRKSLTAVSKPSLWYAKNKHHNDGDGVGNIRDVQPIASSNSTSNPVTRQRRRIFFKSTFVATWGFMTAATTTIGSNSNSAAYYVLDDETGEYIEKEEENWQTTWKARYDKASSMSTDEIFKAARGAGNLELNNNQESNAAIKRRALSACRDSTIRQKLKAGTQIECTQRVLEGEIDFIL